MKKKVIGKIFSLKHNTLNKMCYSKIVCKLNCFSVLFFVRKKEVESKSNNNKTSKQILSNQSPNQDAV